MLNNSLFLISRIVAGNHGHMLFDVVLPALWALNKLHAHPKNSINIIDDSFRIVFMDKQLEDAMDDRIKILTPHSSPVYNQNSFFGNLCDPGVWCAYKNVYGKYAYLSASPALTDFL